MKYKKIIITLITIWFFIMAYLVYNTFYGKSINTTDSLLDISISNIIKSDMSYLDDFEVISKNTTDSLTILRIDSLKSTYLENANELRIYLNNNELSNSLTKSKEAVNELIKKLEDVR